MMDLIIRPVKFFHSLRNRTFTLWAPIIILLLTGIFDGVVTAITVEHTSLTEIVSGGFPILKSLYFILISNFMFYLILTLQVFLFPVIIRKLGGTGGSRKHSFYILGMSTMPLLIQSIIHLLFPGTVWWQYFEHMSVLYFLSYSLFNIFNIWSIALLIIGFAKVYAVSYKKASILYVQFVIKLIPLMIITLLVN